MQTEILILQNNIDYRYDITLNYQWFVTDGLSFERMVLNHTVNIDKDVIEIIIRTVDKR